MPEPDNDSEKISLINPQQVLESLNVSSPRLENKLKHVLQPLLEKENSPAQLGLSQRFRSLFPQKQDAAECPEQKD